MPADDPFSFLPEQPQPQAKPKKRDWREKLFSKDKSKIASQTNQEIADFLGTRAPVSAPAPAPPPVDPRYVPPQNSHIPSLGHSAFPQSKPAPSVPAPVPHRENYAAFDFSDHQPSSAPAPAPLPHVIGEGGDESEQPTIEISSARQKSLSQTAQSGKIPTSSQNPSRSNLPNLRVDTSLGDGESRSQRAGSSPRRDDWKPSLMQNTRDADFLQTLPLHKSGSRLSFRGDTEESLFAQRVRDKMQAEEGRAFHHRYDDDTPSPGAEDEELSTPRVRPAPKCL
ncbi:Cys/Met metabolism pyridoxal phosphate-dependent enzyme [Penicillium soppii]|uniref:Cys/Met metabolism pyridoxal phosphate-dependent enzyme n=1 Tax=Penicillium soppii TaxID=69789 RepID=UPI002547DC7D|nr:Cys/Met metabolism pyridoxal phosphate-dependent enzyme [Penicillium soppii]KAJ5876331.1 Cys/Met metabolism pyridoxal phosphate-dependent enzyme [Penicillium soppii]